jgi:hypothetical protein
MPKYRKPDKKNKIKKNKLKKFGQIINFYTKYVVNIVDFVKTNLRVAKFYYLAAYCSSKSQV